MLVPRKRPVRFGLTRVARIAFGGILLAASFGCASTAAPVPDDSRVLARLYDAQRDLELALANQTHRDLQQLRSQVQANANLKLVGNDVMGELLLMLDRNGMNEFGVARDGPIPEGSGYLLVEYDDLRRVFLEPDAGDPATARQAYIRLKRVMGYYYGHVGSLQYVENPDGPAIFRSADT